MSPRRPRDAYARLIGAAAITLCACLGTLAVALWWNSSQAVHRETRQQLLTSARQIRWQIEQLVREREHSLQLAAELEVMEDARLGDPARRVQALLRRLEPFYKEAFLEVSVTDGRGRVVASTGPRAPGSTLALDRLGIETRTRAAQVGLAPVLVPGDGRRALTIARPLRLGLGPAHGGWLVAFLDWTSIDRLLLRPRREGAADAAAEFFVLAGTRGRVLAGHAFLPGADGRIPEGVRDAPVEGLRRARLAGREYRILWTPVRPASTAGGNGWRVVAFQDASVGAATVWGFALALIVSALLSLLVGVYVLGGKARELARREESMRAMLERSLLALLDLSREFSVNLNEKQLASAALLGVMGHTGSSRAAIWLNLGDPEGRFACVESSGVSVEANALLGELLGALRGRPDLVEGDAIRLDAAPAYVGAELVRLATLQGFVYLLPVVVGGAVVGFVALGGTVAGATPTALDLDAVRTTLGMFGAAVENSRLYDRLRDQNRRLEEINQQLQDTNVKLKEAARLKNEILSNTSHELRTPLTGVIGFLDLVADGSADSMEQVRQFADYALTAARRLLNLINDLLDFSQMEAGKLTLNPSSVAVEEVLREVGDLVGPEATARGLTLQVEAESARGVRVWADRSRLRQVLAQIVGNGVKFTPHGTVTVCVRADLYAGQCTFEVVDTGIGIPVETVERIMQPFVQGDGSSTRQHGGTGIGLAISRGLVEWMGGRITIEATEGHPGTRVRISLPLAEDIAPTESPDTTARRLEVIQGPAGGSLVLVVEDSEAVRDYLTATLRREGYRTAEADSAESGWLVARRLRPSAIITDYAMQCSPDSALRTGLDLALRLGTDPSTRRIPILFLTGFAIEMKDEMEKLADPERSFALMSKPFEETDLLGVLRRWLGTRRVMRVLVAETNEVNAALVQRALPAERFAVEITLGGDHFLEFLRDQPQGFDLLLVNPAAEGSGGFPLLSDPLLWAMTQKIGIVLLTDAPAGPSADRVRLGDDRRIRGRLSRAEIEAAPDRLTSALEFHASALPADPAEPRANGRAEDERDAGETRAA